LGFFSKTLQFVGVQPDIHILWASLKAILSILGGFAGVTKIIEWLFSGPKIIGDGEQIIYVDFRDGATGKHMGTAILALMYAVNKRITPTTIRGMNSFIKINGNWKQVTQEIIPDGFKVPGVAFDFIKSRFYENAWQLLEYGKGIRGWIKLFVPEEKSENLQGLPIKFVLQDAFGKKHTIYYKRSKEAHSGLSYYPGSGLQSGD
jgi:hypothetical protein